MIVLYFLTALLLTIAIESLVVLIAGYRRKAVYLSVILVNMLTNPLLNYILLVVSSLQLLERNLFVILSFEVMVVIVEWRLLLYALKGIVKRPFMLSLAMNTASWLGGLVLFHS